MENFNFDTNTIFYAPTVYIHTPNANLGVSKTSKERILEIINQKINRKQYENINVFIDKILEIGYETTQIFDRQNGVDIVTYIVKYNNYTLTIKVLSKYTKNFDYKELVKSKLLIK